MIVVKYVRKVQLRFQRVNECTRHYVTSTNMRVQIRRRVRHEYECTRYFVTTFTSTNMRVQIHRRVRHEYECTRYFVTTSTSTRVQSRRWVRNECTKYFVTNTSMRVQHRRATHAPGTLSRRIQKFNHVDRQGMAPGTLSRATYRYLR